MTVATGREPRRDVRSLSAYGETKSVWRWSRDERCFIGEQALYQRVLAFPREMTEVDGEAALCLTRKLWRFYRRYGYVDQELLDAELGE